MNFTHDERRTAARYVAQVSGMPVSVILWMLNAGPVPSCEHLTVACTALYKRGPNQGFFEGRPAGSVQFVAAQLCAMADKERRRR